MSCMVNSYRFGGGGGAPTPTPTPVEFVGSKTFTHNATAQQTTSLTDLVDTSGNPATLQDGDLLLVNLSYASNSADRTFEEMICPGCIAAHTDLFSSDVSCANQLVQYRWVHPSLDSSLTVPAATNTAFGIAVTIHAFREVEPLSPLDVTPTTATGSNSIEADPPSITPTTSGSLIVACGAGSGGSGESAYANPSGMSATTNHFRTAKADATNDALAGTALYTSWSSGAYDPAPFTSAGSDTSDAWCAVTLALRGRVTDEETTVTGSFDTLTIGSGEVGSNLTDFPVFVDLSDLSVGFWAGVAADGGDIRVTNSDGSVILPFDLVAINTGAETGVLFFKAPSVLAGSSNVFRVYYDTGLSLLAANHPQGRNAVWRDYEAVHFFNSDLASHTANGRTLTVESGSAAYATNLSKAPGGFALDTGTGLQVAAKESIPATAVFTFAATVVMDTNNTDNQQAVTLCQSFGSSSNRVTIGNRQTGEVYTSFSADDSWLDGSAVSVGTAVRLAATYDGSTARKLYINGSLAGTDNTITSKAMDTLVIGGGSASGANWRGRIGFAYVRRGLLSADWLAAEYSNLNAPASFYSIS